MKTVLGREVKYVAKALVSARHYRAMLMLCARFDRPGRVFWNYVTRSGLFPANYVVHTPIGQVRLRLYSVDDLMTLNEVFAREDYKATPQDRIVVDVGSNIGISAGYFLSRSLDSYVYAHEPVPRNIARLHDNLKPFRERYAIDEVAVGTESGQVTFGIEDTGRYGGVGLNTGESIRVECVKSNDILDRVLARHGAIDILKADVEGYEEKILLGIAPSVLPRIRKIYAEHTFRQNPISETHDFRQYGNVAQFWLREPKHGAGSRLGGTCG
jgi:FkbM family methyltransferase